VIATQSLLDVAFLASYIVGYDNYWQESPDRLGEPTGPMATVDKLNLRLGYELMDLMLARMQASFPLNLNSA
jgi:hypothetical protein